MDVKKVNELEKLTDEALIDYWKNINEQVKDTSYCFLNNHIFAFQSGIGNDVYGAYFGMNRLGNIYSLVIDLRTTESITDLIHRFDWGRSYDNGNNHNSKIEKDCLDVETCAGYNHMAIFLRWMRDHDLLSDEVKLFEPQIMNEKQDLRDLLDLSAVFRGHLRRNHFNSQGQYFANHFYVFNLRSNEGFPSCVDLYAESYFGDDYNNEKYHDEAYLFVPYDENYYQGLSKYIDEAWQRIMEEK